ncbi:MAG: response regulator [Anaerolineales bacterium]|nr:response regulator [Anaerolineales bacterium]
MPGERVLVVDDNDAFRSLMATHLQRRGYAVESARDGLDALQVLRGQAQFAVMVTDLMMPNMSGLELIREVRKFDEHVQVVVITAAATLETAISAMRADGAYDYLLKPLEVIGELSVAVERAAAHRRLRLEREELQAKLAMEANRLQTLIAHTGDAIIAGDADSNLTVVNPAGARLLGKEMWVGQPAFNLLPPALATLLRNWQSAGGRRPTMLEIPWHNNGVQLVNLTTLAEPDGRPGWVMVLRDVTHLRRLDDLRMSLLTEAAGKIRFPLAQAIIALAELNDVPEAKAGRSGDLIQRLVRLWDRIWQWMESLLALVQVESGENIRLADVDLATVLAEVGQLRSLSLIREKGLHFIVEPVPALPQVRADPELLRQLLNGLLIRAATRSTPGGEIRLAAREHDNQVWVDVADTGAAVPEAELPHIFERTFVEAGSSGEGTGLELALVKAIIERLGGQVWVGSQGPIGSLLTVCLPTAPRPASSG